jgi:hypothetical protein
VGRSKPTTSDETITDDFMLFVMNRMVDFGPFNVPPPITLLWNGAIKLNFSSLDVLKKYVGSWLRSTRGSRTLFGIFVTWLDISVPE